MRLRGVYSGLFVLGFGLIVTAGCSSNSSTSTSQSEATAGASASSTTQTSADKVIRIGIDLPVSGADASTGIPTQNGAVLAIEEANSKGLPGGFKLVPNALDDAQQGVHDPALGAQNVKTFIADPTVLAMIGPFNSNVAKAEIPLTNDAGFVQIAPSTTNTGLTKGDDAAKLRTSHPDVNTFFRVCTTDDRQGAAGAKFVQRLGFKRAFVVDDNETYGKGLADVFEQQFAALGGTILGHEHITKNQQDFKALLTKANSLKPDVVFYGGTTSSGGGLLRKQMADVGMRGVPFVGGDGISDDEFLHTAGDMANNSYYTVAAPEAEKLPAARTFVATYVERWKSPVGAYSANAYTAANVEIAAIEKAIKKNGGAMPTRADVLRNVAATRDFDSPIGKVGFDARGDTTNPILTLREIKGGKPVYIGQVNLKP